MTFDEWCESKQIKGNWKEALFHSLAARFDGINNIPEDEKIWADEWNIILSKFYVPATFAMLGKKQC